MPTDDQKAVDRLDNELDHVVSSSPIPASPLTADQELTDAHRRLRSLDGTPGPNPDFVRNLMEELMHATPLSLGGHIHATLNGAIQARPLDPLTRTTTAARARRQWRLLPLVAAAVLVLAGGGVVLRDELPVLRRDGNAVIPAAMAPVGTPDTTSMTEETLLDIEIPAEFRLDGDVMGVLRHITVVDGVSTWTGPEPGMCCVGIRVDYVLTGGYTIMGDGTLYVSRTGSGVWEAIPARTTVKVGEGDTVVSAHYTSTTYETLGAGPVEMLFWNLVESSVGITSDPIPAGWIINEEFSPALTSLEAGPAALRLRLVDLPPDVVLEPVGLQYGVTAPFDDEGNAVPPFLFVRNDGRITNDGGAVLPVYVLTLESLTGVPSTSVATPSA